MIQIDKKICNSLETNLNDQFSWTYPDTIHRDLLATKELVYNLCEIECSQPYLEAQNAEYGAYLFNANSLSIRFRVAKITPKKIGQFVTFWQRMGDGTTQPFDVSEPVDYFVISTRDGNKFGQFVFPKYALLHHDIVSNKGKGGKRGMRVYPSWDKPTSHQAQKTQKWQLEYFLETPINEPLKFDRARILYSQNNKKVQHEYHPSLE